MKISKAMRRVVAARTTMVLDHAFWGVLALRLKLVEDPTCPTAWTDGTHMGFNPDFVTKITFPQLIFVIAHEVSHCALGHPWRIGQREPFRWNMAGDYVINLQLKAAGFDLLPGVLYDTQWEKCSTDWVYDRLPSSPQAGGGGAGAGAGRPGGRSGQVGHPGPGEPGGPMDEVRPAPSLDDDPYAQSEQEWQQAVVEAEKVARKQGQGAGGMDVLVRQVTRPHIDWRSALRRFVQQTARDDYTFRRPSRRHLQRGMYLPSLRSAAMGTMVVGWDTSGSMVDKVTQAKVAAELTGIIEDARPERVIVMYTDWVVANVEVFERGEPPVFRPKGGGGTSFVPVFEAIKELEEEPVCLVYLTDLEGEFPDEEPEYPVLWVTVGEWASDRAPFGEVLPLDS